MLQFLHFISQLLFVNIVITHDPFLCVLGNTSQSCTHQISQNDVKCLIEYIPRTDCLKLRAFQEFSPYNLPFNLNVYMFTDGVLHTVAPNISFPNPTWQTMYFHLANQNNPESEICRRIILNKNDSSEMLKIQDSIFWDCLLFSVENIEANAYDLYIEKDEFVGGSYNFKFPSVKNYGIGRTSISEWNVFFFIHQHYIQSDSKLFLTMQPAPFSKITYSVSLLRCFNEEIECLQNITIEQFFIDQKQYEEQHDKAITVSFKNYMSYGSYVIVIEMLSLECKGHRCSKSISPIIHIRKSYEIEILIGVFLTIFFIFVITYLLMKKIQVKFSDYLKGDSSLPVSVLFIYHSESEEKFILFKHFAKILEQKLFCRVYMVDSGIKTEDPNSWLRNQICTASRVLFFLPKDSRSLSVTPVQYQWHCALNYFSGKYLKENRDFFTRFCVVLLPDSATLSAGAEIYNLRRFDLSLDLVNLVNWIHRKKFIDKFLFWRPIIKGIRTDLDNFIQFAVNPDCSPKPDDKNISPSSSKIHYIKHNSEQPHVIDDKLSSLGQGSLEDFDTSNESYEFYQRKADNEFDSLLPDVHSVDDRSEHDVDSLSADECEDDCSENGSDTDIMNFAI